MKVEVRLKKDYETTVKELLDLVIHLSTTLGPSNFTTTKNSLEDMGITVYEEEAE